MRGIGAPLRPGDRGDEHQPAVSPIEQVGKRRWAQSNAAVRLVAMIRSQLRGSCGERRAVADAGIDDQHVDRAVGGARFVEGGFDRVAVGDVAGDRGAADDRATARAARSGGRAARPWRPPREVGRGRGADAGSAAGDQRMAAF
jgi:hypothetical protein